MSVLKNSIINSIFSINDRSIQPFLNATKNTEEYKDIILKYNFNDLKKMYFNNNNLIEEITICKNDDECLPYRDGIIKWLFTSSLEVLKKKYKNLEFNKNFYHAVGSTNPTSDYDITIISKISYEITLIMFKLFITLTEYKTILPISLDVNIYNKGIFLYDNINPNLITNFKIFKFKIENNLKSINDFLNENNELNIYLNTKNPTVFTFEPKNIHDIKTSFLYALIKIVELKKNIVKNSEIEYNKYYVNAVDEYNDLLNKFNNFKINNNLINNKIKKKEYKDIIKKYFLNYHFSKLINNEIYSKKNISKNFYKNLCKCSFYSIESYYTVNSTNVVLLEMQMKLTNLNLDPVNYICSIIENFGDFNNHFNENKDFYLEILDKSKYIYRILYSLCKLKDIYKFDEIILSCLSGINNNNLENFIKKCRGKTICNNKEIIDNLLNLKIFNNNIKIDDKNFLNIFNNKILNIIDTLLNNYKFKTNKKVKTNKIKINKKVKTNKIKINKN